MNNNSVEHFDENSPKSDNINSNVSLNDKDDNNDPKDAASSKGNSPAVVLPNISPKSADSNVSLKDKGDNNPKETGSSKGNSPVIVLTNADYKRPSSILSSRSSSTVSSTESSDDFFSPFNWWGGLMLGCHFFIGSVRIKINLLFKTNLCVCL